MPESKEGVGRNSSRLTRLETTNQVLAAIISIGVVVISFFMSRLYTKLDKIDEQAIIVARMDERLKSLDQRMRDQLPSPGAASYIGKLSSVCDGNSVACLTTIGTPFRDWVEFDTTLIDTQEY